MGESLRRAAWSALALLTIGCSFIYGAGIHVQRPDGAPPFTQPEQDAAKAIVVDICRAERFWQRDAAPNDPAPSSPYVEFVSLDGKGSEQDTVGVSGMMRTDRREILIWVSDWMRGDPLPTTQKLVDDLRAALERRFPDAHVEVEARKKLRTFAP